MVREYHLKKCNTVMRTLDLIVIHCTATKEGVDVDVATVREWHKQRGFSDIGYHYLIHIDGYVEDGRDICRVGAHAKGHNAHSIGVAYVGGLDKDGRSKDTRTPEQKDAMKELVGGLQVVFGIRRVVGHRDLSVDLNDDGVITPDEWMKDCPCFNAIPEFD